MTKKLFGTAMAVAALACLTGCVSNREFANVTPGANLKSIKTIYVVKQPKDDNGIELLIKDDLTKRGYTVTTGPELTTAYPADASVTYIDKWMWDITMYLLDLTITVKDPTGFPMATGQSHHASLTRESPPTMVHEVVDNIMKQANQ
ncbi:MAG: hypothetical protein JO002_01555 [Burkholderiaceae bacterium]|nr:hypothetical protein [Burkholderiaceae bacterium]